MEDALTDPPVPSSRARPDRAEAARVWLSRWIVSPLAGVTLGDWLGMLAANRFMVHPLYWPRAALTTVLSAVNSFEARRERKRFAEGLAELEVRRPVFVLGHYRSGTTHLHNLLCADERFTYPNNLAATYAHSFLTTEDSKRRLGEKLTMSRRPQDNVKLDLSVPGEDELALCALTGGLSPHMAWHFPRRAARYESYLTLREASDTERETWHAALSTFARKLTLASGGRTVVLKSPCHTARVRLILEVFPDARFVHIRRNPYEVYSSTLKMERTVPPHFAYQRRDPRSVEDFVLRRFRSMYDAYLDDAPRVPSGQLCEVAYEDLEADPVGTLEHVYATLELPDFARARGAVQAHLAGVADYAKNRYRELAPDARRRVAQAWAPCFAAWGYDSD